jgi:nicotinate-nucleotide--dimethylbenzimidazole phosphoribosyltransferase
VTTQTARSDATDVAAAAQRAVDEKTKPVGSLGELEAWAVRLASIQGTLTPRIERARVVVFGADHGVAAEGVSAYPAQVTAEMMRNFGRGGAAINVLTRANAVEVEVIDVGVDADLQGASGIVHAKVRRGSRNMAVEPAMTPGECDAALAVGRDAARRAAGDGVRAIGLGDMGIGNTTAAAALLSALTGVAPAQTVGRGTGVDDERLAHKRAVVTGAIARHHAAGSDPRAALEALGGLEIAAMCGAALEAPAHGMAIVADGFISSVAVLAACRIDPSIARHVFVAHRSAEAGHGVAIDALGARPMLSLNLRLGEGTGAALAIPLLRAAAAMLSDMATFASAGVSRDR